MMAIHQIPAWRPSHALRLLCGLATLFVVLGAHPRPAIGQSGGATLLILSEPVEVASQTSAGFAPGQSGQLLRDGDRVRTGPGAAALLTFFDGSESVLAENTELQIQSSTPGGGPISLLQAAGTTLNRVRAVSATGAGFQTDTPAAVALVRGTTYVTSVSPLRAEAEPAVAQDDGLALRELFAEDAVGAPEQVEPETFEGQAGLEEGEPFQQAQGSNAPGVSQALGSRTAATLVLLLTDPDGRVGRLEVRAPSTGLVLPLETAGRVAVADPTTSTFAARSLSPALLQQWQQIARDFRDVQAIGRVTQLVRSTAAAASAPSSEQDPTPPPPASGGGSSPGADQRGNRLLALANELRASRGVPPLSRADGLDQAALEYSALMRDTGCNGHDCFPDIAFEERLRRLGYGPERLIAENLARGQATAEAALASWLGSEIHRANLLDPELKQAGSALASGGALGTYWVLILTD